MYRIQNKNELEQSLENNVKLNEVKQVFLLPKTLHILCVLKVLKVKYLSVKSTTSTLLSVYTFDSNVIQTVDLFPYHHAHSYHQFKNHKKKHNHL